MNELNPNHPVTKTLHDNWHKLCALMIYKLKLAEVIITAGDVEGFIEQHPDSAVLARDAQDGLHLMLVTMAQAEALAKTEPVADAAHLPKGLTTDPTDPRLGHGVDDKPVPQNEVYLILSEEERAKGFVRPLRRSYRHVGERPKHRTRPLTEEERARHVGAGYVLYEIYPDGESPVLGRFWTERQLESGCGETTTMGLALCETYARRPDFYGSTYCTYCQKHLPVAEFIWTEDGQRVGS